MKTKFENLLRPLDDDELKRLKESCLKQGIRDPLVIWDEQDILLDGHNRYQIAQNNQLDFKIERISLPSESDARKWIINNQLGRRNLTPNELSYFRGLRYREEKQSHGGDRKSSNQNDDLKTSETLAKEFGVSAPTIQRDEKYAEALDKVTETEGEDYRRAALKGEVTKKDVIEKASPPKKENVHVANNTGFQEWYTPRKYIESARKVMDAIELDPASSEKANEIVRAEKIYTAEDDGLTKNWYGKVWMNPPYASDLIEKFINKIVHHANTESIEEAIVLVNNATETRWFNSLIGVSDAVVFPQGRVKFLDQNLEPAGAPLQGQAFVYIGNDSARFLDEFMQYGWGAEL